MIIIKDTPPPVVEQKPKAPFRISKHVLITLIFCIVISSLLGGTFLLQSEQRSGTPIRIKVPFRPENNDSPNNISPTPSPTPDPTASWKTYANKSFSMRYPNRFTITEQSPQFSARYPKIYASVVFAESQGNMTITVAKNTQNLSATNALGNGPGLAYTARILQGKKVIPVTIDGADGEMVTQLDAGQTGVSTDVTVIKYGKIYQMTLTPRTADPTTFALMLSTIKLLDQEPADETENWNVRIDNTYNFGFRYPTNYTLDFNKVASGSSTITTVFNNSSTQVDTTKLKIEVLDIKNVGLSAVTSRAILQLPLQDFVNKKWEYNKVATDTAIPNRQISAIQQTSIDGRPAYQFSVTGKYVDDINSELLSEAYLFIFTENNGVKYKIWFPMSNLVYSQIVRTFIFTK